MPLNSGSLFRHSQELRLAFDVLLFELFDNRLGNCLLILRRKSQDSRSCTRQADTQQSGVRSRCDGGENGGQTWDEIFAVRLVDSVLHCLENEVRVGWGAGEGCCEDC